MHKIDRFTRAYLECALWSTTHFDTGRPLDEDYDIDDLADETIAQAVEDCNDFREAQAEDLAQAGDDEQNGHDFWLTRNRHGAGFWDRGLGDVGKRLTDAAHVYGSVDLMPCEDGKIR
jgi:hypothetical protein